MCCNGAVTVTASVLYIIQQNMEYLDTSTVLSLITKKATKWLMCEYWTMG